MKKKGGKLTIDNNSIKPKEGAAAGYAAIKGVKGGRKSGSIGNTYQEVPGKTGNVKGNH